MSCPERHTRDDPRIGEPLCPDCYDYTGAVLFNACAPELWRRFTITLRRSLARQAGLTGKALAAQVRVSYAKVAEYQRRGVVHFHAIIRLDGPAGPATPPPTWGYQPGGDGLFALVRGAVGAQHAKGGGVGTASTVTPRSSSPNGNSPDATSRSPTCPARSVCRAPPPAVKGWTRLPDTDRLLTVAQAAELLATSERFPRRLIAERRIRFVRLGESGKRGHVRIPESALREFIAAGLIEPLTTPHARRAA
jgi:excisionase family DNA binding protein